MQTPQGPFVFGTDGMPSAEFVDSMYKIFLRYSNRSGTIPLNRLDEITTFSNPHIPPGEVAVCVERAQSYFRSLQLPQPEQVTWQAFKDFYNDVARNDAQFIIIMLSQHGWRFQYHPQNNIAQHQVPPNQQRYHQSQQMMVGGVDGTNTPEYLPVTYTVPAYQEQSGRNVSHQVEYKHDIEQHPVADDMHSAIQYIPTGPTTTIEGENTTPPDPTQQYYQYELKPVPPNSVPVYTPGVAYTPVTTAGQTAYMTYPWPVTPSAQSLGTPHDQFATVQTAPEPHEQYIQSEPRGEFRTNV